MTMPCSLAGRVSRLALAVAIITVGAAAPAFGRAPERDHVQQTFEGVTDSGAFQDTYVDEETGDLS